MTRTARPQERDATRGVSSKRPRASRGVSPRSLTVTLLVLLGLGVVLFLAWYFLRPDAPVQSDAIEFEYFSEDSTATVGFAGMFPPIDQEPLDRPLGIDGDGENLYIAEADAGMISVRAYDGALIETFTVEPAEGAPAFYPVDVAVLSDGALGIVDTAGARVVRVDPADPGGAELLLPVDLVSQPTAIESFEDMIYVADATSAVIHAVSAQSPSESVELAADLDPPLTFVGGMYAEGSLLYVSDSNAGRIVIVDRETGALQGTFFTRLELPRSLVGGPDGTISVVETFGRRVLLFDPSGQSLRETIGDERTEGFSQGGGLSAPQGLYFDSAGERFYVTDPPVGRVKVYNIREE